MCSWHHRPSGHGNEPETGGSRFLHNKRPCLTSTHLSRGWNTKTSLRFCFFVYSVLDLMEGWWNLSHFQSFVFVVQQCVFVYSCGSQPSLAQFRTVLISGFSSSSQWALHHWQWDPQGVVISKSLLGWTRGEWAHSLRSRQQRDGGKGSWLLVYWCTAAVNSPVSVKKKKKNMLEKE